MSAPSNDNSPSLTFAEMMEVFQTTSSPFQVQTGDEMDILEIFKDVFGRVAVFTANTKTIIYLENPERSLSQYNGWVPISLNHRFSTALLIARDHEREHFVTNTAMKQNLSGDHPGIFLSHPKYGDSSAIIRGCYEGKWHIVLVDMKSLQIFSWLRYPSKQVMLNRLREDVLPTSSTWTRLNEHSIPFPLLFELLRLK